MVRPLLEVADVLRAHAADYMKAAVGRVTPAKLRVLADLQACRTALLGGHVEECDDCGHQQNAYNSCRNRHCPKCQGSARAAWLEARAADLLPVEYFHVVFTLPDEVAELALQNKRELYGLLFHAAAATLKKVAAIPRLLGAAIGFIAVLHTWGQTLLHHPHLHCIVPGGGLSPDGRWVGCRPGFFLPVQVLSRVFRGNYLAGLAKAFAGGRLVFQGKLAGLTEPASFSARLAAARSKEWVVYAKPPFGGPEQVLKYLARYTHRVAITNHRLIQLQDGRVTFLYKDYAHGHRQRRMTLDANEFIRRFLLHVLPKGFAKIRHYGILANRSDKLDLCRAELGCSQPVADAEASAAPADTGASKPAPKCPACGSSAITVRQISALHPAAQRAPCLDSS